MINIGKATVEHNNVIHDHSIAKQQAKAKLLSNNEIVGKQVDLSSGVLSADKTQKILQQELVSKLQQRFELEGIELKGLKAEDYTPEKVAGRILSFVEAGVGRADDDEERNDLMEQARKGIEQGFKDAREILDSIGVLNGKVKEDIDKTYDLIQAGLDKLANPQDEEDKDDSVKLIDQAGVGEMSASESRRTSVEIMTRDGDKVTIDLSREQNHSSSAYFAENDNQSVYGARSSSSSYTSIKYQVEGELDDDERAAIDDLLNNLSDVARDFYQGDIETAFNKAQEVGFDTDELAQFSVDISHERTAQYAVAAYQNNRQLESDVEQKQDSEQNSFVKDAAEFMHRLDELMKHNAFEFLSNPEKSIADLLTASIGLQDDEENSNNKASSNSLFNDMIDSLKDVNKESDE